MFNFLHKIRILLVEDDPSLGYIIKDRLTDEGFEVKWCKDGQDAFQVFFNQTFDICLIDVMLPKKDGFTLAEDLRKLNLEIPLIFLTAKSLTHDKIKGFKTGADDYITKPFEMEELLFRMNAILKRTINKKEYHQTDKKDVFTIGNYRFDFKNLELTLNNNTRVLTKKEAELLRLLCIHENNVLPRDMALNIVWGKDDYFLGRSMDVFITRLRKYLEHDKTVAIANVHGVGFKLTVNHA